MAGLSGLLTLFAGSVIRLIGSERSSAASIGPPFAPSSASAARTVGVSAANAGKGGNRRPNRPRS
jgi:hypothetical protein